MKPMSEESKRKLSQSQKLRISKLEVKPRPPSNMGKRHSLETRRKIGQAHRERARRIREMWIWDEMDYGQKHNWAREHFEDPGLCEACGQHNDLQWASIGHGYTQKRADWLRLCRSCHRRMDNRGVLPVPLHGLVAMLGLCQ